MISQAQRTILEAGTVHGSLGRPGLWRQTAWSLASGKIVTAAVETLVGDGLMEVTGKFSARATAAGRAALAT